MARILDVYMHEVLAGKFTQNDKGQLLFKYDESYLSRRDVQPISVSLPLGIDEYKEKNVRAFFSGLLPEAMARHTIAHNLGVSEKNPFSLLEKIGGECAGALAVYPENQKPPAASHMDIEILYENKLSQILSLLSKCPLMTGSDNIRLSLAGAQNKLAVTLIDNNIGLIHGTTPTTHILKPLIENLKDTVHNEFFCLRLAARMNINVPEVAIGWANGAPYYLIARYDRVNIQGTVKRLHQEDFCQALGIMPELKYEREGGPSITRSLELIQQYAQNPAADRLAFLRLIIFNYLIGNADAHGKNFSFLYEKDRISLAPAYDLLSTEVYPEISMKMAMKIGSRYEPYEIFARYWHTLIPDNAAAQNALNKEILKMAAECLQQAEMLKLELKTQGIYSDIFQDIHGIIRKRAAYISKQFERS